MTLHDARARQTPPLQPERREKMAAGAPGALMELQNQQGRPGGGLQDAFRAFRERVRAGWLRRVRPEWGARRRAEPSRADGMRSTRARSVEGWPWRTAGGPGAEGGRGGARET